ncbi:hypothetical protein U9M48_042552 [Paspalum notatum var. saurae]|uniref:Uncharacterized protein n=1 Tax=Paspalum notatum var. saurae TaxID=547442 RepID=A0AAQ3UVB4_PASNO
MLVEGVVLPRAAGALPSAADEELLGGSSSSTYRVGWGREMESRERGPQAQPELSRVSGPSRAQQAVWRVRERREGVGRVQPKLSDCAADRAQGKPSMSNFGRCPVCPCTEDRKILTTCLKQLQSSRAIGSTRGFGDKLDDDLFFDGR